MQKFSDAPVTIHEGCGGAVERLISAPALQFKGSGWYITDYARNGKDSGSGSKSKPDTKTESKAESKTESKTESKPNTPASSS
jgi:predicted nucleic acid-binding Zn ribbon protein